jgi:hypothetical protein
MNASINLGSKEARRAQQVNEGYVAFMRRRLVINANNHTLPVERKMKRTLSSCISDRIYKRLLPQQNNNRTQ